VNRAFPLIYTSPVVQTPLRTIPALSAILWSALASWVVMMTSGAALMAAAEWYRTTTVGVPMVWDAFLIAFVVAACVPFILVIAAVYLPVSVAMFEAGMPGPPVSICALAGALAGPLTGLLLLAAGHALFANRFDPHLSLWADLARLVTRHAFSLGPPLVSLMLGGAVFGGGLAWARRYACPPR
jgi:hypothetical protein